MVFCKDLLLEDLRVRPAVVFPALKRQHVTPHISLLLVGLFPPALIGDAPQLVFEFIAQPIAEDTLEQPFHEARRACGCSLAAPVPVAGEIAAYPFIRMEELV